MRGIVRTCRDPRDLSADVRMPSLASGVPSWVTVFHDESSKQPQEETLMSRGVEMNRSRYALGAMFSGARSAFRSRTRSSSTVSSRATWTSTGRRWPSAPVGFWVSQASVSWCPAYGLSPATAHSECCFRASQKQ